MSEFKCEYATLSATFIEREDRQWHGTIIVHDETYDISLLPMEDNKEHYTWKIVSDEYSTRHNTAYYNPQGAAQGALLCIRAWSQRRHEPNYGLRWLSDGLYHVHHPDNPYMSNVTRNLREMAGKGYGNSISDYVLYCAYYNTEVMDQEQDDAEAAMMLMRSHLDEYMDARDAE